MYLLPFFGTKPQSSMGIIMGSQRPSQAILLGKYGHSPRVGETFCGQARHFIYGLQPTQGMGKPEKACRMSKPCKIRTHMTPNLDGFTSESLDESQWFPSDHQQTPEPIATATEMLPLWLGSQIQRPLQKKRKTVNVFWFL